MENYLEISTKDENTHTQWLSNTTPVYTINRNVYVCAQKDMYKIYHSNII